MKFTFLLLLLSILPSCSTSSQKNGRTISTITSSAWIDNIREIAAESVDNGYNAGIAIGVTEESGKQSIYTFGKMRLSDYSLISKSTIFEIASITKVLTAELLAKFVIEKKVSLDDEVRKFIPALSEVDAGKITLKELSTHTSGLPRLPANLDPKDPKNPYADYTLEQLMSFLQTYKETKTKPYAYKYSNLAVGLLGYILAEVNLKDYETTLKEEVLNPLNLSMTISLNSAQKDNFATPYNSNLEQALPWELGVFNGAGGVKATIEDMQAFAQAQLAPESTSLKDAIQLTQKIHYKGDDSQMGLGWVIRPSDDGPIYLKDGATGGFISLILVQPSTGRALTMLSNTANNIPCLMTYFKKEECKVGKRLKNSIKLGQ